MSLFDTHCHLNHPLLMAQHDHVRADMNHRHVGDVLVPTTRLADWPTLLQLPTLYPEQTLHFALGVHPHYLPDDVDQTLADLSLMLATPSIKHMLCAIGEIGLDRVDKTQPPAHMARQLALFQGQLALAQAHQLPIVLHSTHAVYPCLNALRAAGFSHGGYAHAFGGSVQEAEQLIAMGFKIGIGPMVYHPTAKKFKLLAQTLPLASLAFETDAPFPIKETAPDGHRLTLPGDVARVAAAVKLLRSA